MKFPLLYILLISGLLLPDRILAWHIIGGELNYKCVGTNQYEITLRIWRDCNSTTQYDDPAVIGVFLSNGVLHSTISIGFPGSIHINPNIDPCMQLPPGICVEQATYKKTITLPNSSGGYTLAYQRCCRNNTIVNIINPEDVGATYTAYIPDNSVAVCNSNPYFDNYPPIVICVNEPLVFDHSATDPDGDQLVYSLCTPHNGADPIDPMPIPPPPPPYGYVTWDSPYGLNNQIGGVPAMSIDANTGLLTGSPNAIGQFVVGVCVSEYRNGTLIDKHVRDFQFNVTTCSPLIHADFTTQFGEPNDTLLVCGSYQIDFDNQSFGSNNYYWDFGDLTTTSDNSTTANPSYTYPSTGVYEVLLVAAPGLNCGDSVVKYIEIREGIIADFGFVSECAFTPVNFLDQSVPLDGFTSSWSWDFGDGNSSGIQHPPHAFSSGGSYNVTLVVENNFGCSDQVTQTVIVYPAPVPNAGPDTFICDVDAVTLFAEDGTSYLWLPNYNLNSNTIGNPLATPDLTTWYFVTVTNSFGCVTVDSVLVMVTDTVIATISPDTTVCQQQPVQLWAIDGVYYQWTPPDGLSDPFISSPVALPDVTTTYYVTSFIGSCFDVDTVTLTILPIPIPDAGADATINQGESVQLHGTGGGSYEWNHASTLTNPFIPDPFAFPLNSTEYLLTVTGDNGCKAIDSVTVFVTHNHQIIAPNAFTPNGDGMNDVFQFYTLGIKEIISVRVFNRWGQNIFYSTNAENTWNGTYKGMESETGTYVFLIQALTYDNYVLTVDGSLHLLR